MIELDLGLFKTGVIIWYRHEPTANSPNFAMEIHANTKLDQLSIFKMKYGWQTDTTSSRTNNAQTVRRKHNTLYTPMWTTWISISVCLSDPRAYYKTCWRDNVKKATLALWDTNRYNVMTLCSFKLFCTI